MRGLSGGVGVGVTAEFRRDAFGVGIRGEMAMVPCPAGLTLLIVVPEVVRTPPGVAVWQLSFEPTTASVVAVVLLAPLSLQLPTAGASVLFLHIFTIPLPIPSLGVQLASVMKGATGVEFWVGSVFLSEFEFVLKFPLALGTTDVVTWKNGVKICGDVFCVG